MAERDGITADDHIGCLCEHFIASVVFECGADVKPPLAAEVPRVVGGYFGMDDKAAAGWAHWRGIKVVGTKKVFVFVALVRKRFRVSSIWGRSRFQCSFG